MLSADPTHAPAVAAPVAWDEQLLRNPHAVADKQRRVRQMFAAIAPSYDLNNRLHSLWMDQAWRRKAVRLATLKKTDSIVDVACGTGDLALRFGTEMWWLCMREPPIAMKPRRGQVVGVDFTFEMLPRARGKARRSTPRLRGDAWPEEDGIRRNDHGNLGDVIDWINGDAQALPL